MRRWLQPLLALCAVFVLLLDRVHTYNHALIHLSMTLHLVVVRGAAPLVFAVFVHFVVFHGCIAQH